MIPLNSVGHRLPRMDALLRVTGKAEYTGDVKMPGMLFAKVLRSPHPHARIKSIDVSKAKALPGVKAVLTYQNCDVTWSSGDTLGQRKIFNNPLRYTGEAVAAVAAVDRHVAEEALLLINVDYEVLPFVTDVDKAMEAGAPEIHPGGNLSPNNQRQRQPQVTRRGDVAQGLAAADRVFEDSFSSVHLNNAQLEIRAALAYWEGPKLTVYASTQGIANCQSDIAKDLKLEPANVRVICHYMGG
ncbi:MAG: molybdopterin cofactor-binding domain-containing protein, partial [Acidobacteriota bacterium]